MNDAATLELVIFEVQGGEYALDLGEVREVARPSRPVPLEADAAPAVGVVRLAGRWLPLLDMRERLGFPSGPDLPRRLLVAQTGGGVDLGLLVEDVVEVLTVPARALEQAPPIFSEPGRSHPRTIVRLEADRLLVLLSLHEIITPDELATVSSARPASDESSPPPSAES